MFSQRRIRVLAVAALVAIILYFHYSGETRSIQNQKFYQSTVAAINAEKASLALGEKSNTGKYSLHTDKDKDQHNAYQQPGAKSNDEYTYIDGDDKLEPAIPKAQPEQQPLKNDEQDTEEIPIAGRTKMTVPKEKSKDETEAEAASAEAEKEEKKKQEQTEKELKEVKEELNGILKQSPIIIFSKSYCPFSKKAKAIILDKYEIVPAPYVVELDQHPLGPRLQSLLGENTGRRTVPNVLVNGRSIGGGDDIAALDDHDELATRMKSLASKWLQEVKRREIDDSA